MTNEELIRGCEKIIEEFSEYESSDEIMTNAVRHAIGAESWLELTEEEKTEHKRELFRAFKAGFNVKFIDDHLTKDDILMLKKAYGKFEELVKAGITEKLQGQQSILFGEIICIIEEILEK